MNEVGNPQNAEIPIRGSFHFAAIAESTDDAIVGKDLSGNVTAWNRGAQLMFGYSAEEMMGQSVTRLIPKQRLGEEAEILERIRSGETISHFLTERRRKDGTIIEVMLIISPRSATTGAIHH
ncbi:PAS domain S-box protein [Acidocella aminolytica]|uniref:histidine kinase n=1 Tax=Acidocella aminolytica 101 = DSM 11237 TaxID=1120923 RepID=A0A0D6PER1_9PROT|nr:PAS domain S-box protein [Acidocella aminolytica]GAN79846.1 two component sensor histidine kinase [Acidocella aminolytica 101 = DSM 11237]GBQ36601.1 hypothetical protein AA11237_1287 [Acidocella aminolytica 101 = DSM 11237]SHF26149.1 PAS domain S-box-containing protein [Acidocella aminolytica 101 = DSM 11237]